jgi:hypothetical protein
MQLALGFAVANAGIALAAIIAVITTITARSEITRLILSSILSLQPPLGHTER